jgi:hypothetical protein
MMEKLNVQATEIFCSIIEKLNGASSTKLKSKGLMDLCVQRLGIRVETPWGEGSIYSLAHYYEQEGDAMRDPDMEFIVVDNRRDKTDYLMIGIYPQMYRQDGLGRYEESVVIEDDKVVSFYEGLQRAHTVFANSWVQSFKSDGFLK